MLSPLVVQAQTIPGPADVGRIKPEGELLAPKSRAVGDPGIAELFEATPIPEDAENIRFVLKGIRLKGVTAFTKRQLASVWKHSLNREISLADAYTIANTITKRYHEAGCLLSLAYLPPQEIDNGIITIKVIEGYIGKVDLPEGKDRSSIVHQHIARLMAEKPITASHLESFLLRINDLPGYRVSGTLSVLEGAADGAVALKLEPREAHSMAQIGVDNYASRFLGPNQMVGSYSASILPMHQTTVSGSTSLPTDELNYLALDHKMAIAPDLTLSLLSNYVKAQPGYTLKPLELESDSLYVGARLNYQWIRQRQTNLSLGAMVDARNNSSDVLGTAFTRDRVRALRAIVDYDLNDRWRGSNTVSMIVSHGIPGLGASSVNDLNLSRGDAQPDFLKGELSLARLQMLTDDWSVLLSASGQLASGSLLSSEEFGYGGQNYGRAYDTSEFTGDHGLAGAMEVRYGRWRDMPLVGLMPYVFYDVGKVWNDNAGQVSSQAASSYGLGMHATSEAGLEGNVGLAWPLIEEAGTPIYGQDDSGPRILLRINKKFSF